MSDEKTNGTNGDKRLLVVKAEVKRRIKDSECQTAGDFVDALDETVQELIEQAIQRARENGRKQVRRHDI
jgi:histone H3/H4